MYHTTPVTCHLSPVTCPLSLVTCHLKLYIFLECALINYPTKTLYIYSVHLFFLSQTAGVIHRQSVTVTASLCLPQTVCVRHKPSVSVKASLWLWQPVCICHILSVSVTNNLCLFQTVFMNVLGQHLDLNKCNFEKENITEIWVCPSVRYPRYPLCGPLLSGFNLPNDSKKWEYIYWIQTHTKITSTLIKKSLINILYYILIPCLMDALNMLL